MKDQNIQSILDACIELEITKGHLKWSLSDLSRVSGVTRSLIYYYFNESKKSLLRRAVQQLADRYLDIRYENIQLMRKGEIFELLRDTRTALMSNPYILQFYSQHRIGNSEYNKIFQRAEDDFFLNMVQTLPQKWRDRSRVLWAFLFGLAIQPDLTEKDLKLAEKMIKQIWK